VPGDRRQMALTRPAAVAVHDDGDVPGDRDAHEVEVSAGQRLS